MITYLPKSMSFVPAETDLAVKLLTQKKRKIPADKLLTRKSSFLRFVTQEPRSRFKHLILTSPLLLQGLRKMSMSKMVPEGLKPRECEHVKLRKPPLVPYVPEKDKVHDEVSKKRNMEIKTTIKKDTTLNFPVWQENRTHEGFLMHVTAVLDTIKKHGHFEDYNKVAYAYKKARKASESARAGLALLSEGRELLKKLSKKKAKEAEKEAAAKAAEPKDPAKAPEEGKEDKVTPLQKDNMKASFSSDLEKARLA